MLSAEPFCSPRFVRDVQGNPCPGLVSRAVPGIVCDTRFERSVHYADSRLVEDVITRHPFSAAGSRSVIDPVAS
jgi:hypothetical protein